MDKPSVHFEPYFGTDKPVFGNPSEAQIEVEVYKLEDGGFQYSARCMCSACFEIEQIGIQELMRDQAPEPGIYYMKSWFEVHPSGPWGPEEYDGGLEIA